MGEQKENMLIMVPKWRHNTFVAVSVSGERGRQSLRLDSTFWRAIDKVRSDSPGNISRNAWITEAILDKLAQRCPEAQKAADQNA
jgi:hypothetical protein